MKMCDNCSTQNKKLAVFICFLFIFNTIYVNTHHCGIGLLKRPKRMLVAQENVTMRSLMQESWEPIRIHLDFSQIENNVGRFLKQDLIDLKEKILPKAKEVFEKLLKVKRVSRTLKLKGDSCDDFKLPDKYIDEGLTDADLIIFVMIDETGFYKENNVEAAAVHCFQDSTSRRPIAGYIKFKPEIGANTQTAVDYMAWLAVHEITHILVMNDSLYEDWVDSSMMPLGINRVLGSKRLPNGKKMNFIKTPNVLRLAKEHFGCNQLDGVPLEYNGGAGTAGAHWSKRMMNTDYMIGDSYGENLISKISLGMFEDSGWYKTDYNLANLFLWGRNSGCDFFNINKKCVEEVRGSVKTKYKNDFCTKLNYPVCSTSHIFRGDCMTMKYRSLKPFQQYFKNTKLGGADPLVDMCPIPIENKQDQIYYGGSCRVGVTMNINKFEKVCPECACFMSNLREIHHEERKEGNNRLKSKDSSITQSDYNIEKKIVSQNISNDYTLKANITNVVQATSSVSVTRKSTEFSISSKLALMKTNTSLKLNQEPLADLTDEDFRTYCFEYNCQGKDLYVKVLDKAYRCEDNTQIFIDGYQGVIKCPPSSVLCDSKFLCKFGCTERYKKTASRKN
jgi:hypothetical protein